MVPGPSGTRCRPKRGLPSTVCRRTRVRSGSLPRTPSGLVDGGDHATAAGPRGPELHLADAQPPPGPLLLDPGQRRVDDQVRPEPRHRHGHGPLLRQPAVERVQRRPVRQQQRVLVGETHLVTGVVRAVTGGEVPGGPAQPDQPDRPAEQGGEPLVGLGSGGERRHRDAVAEDAYRDRGGVGGFGESRGRPGPPARRVSRPGAVVASRVASAGISRWVRPVPSASISIHRRSPASPHGRTSARSRVTPRAPLTGYVWIEANLIRRL